ncbi:MAG TPA: hypothetical protein VMA31_08215 [Bryobacteraceae bacterium]|nr:hypothetical protein [Bryobacteraceae bacterium]
MEWTTREIWTLIHGMGFGGLFLLACGGAIVDLWRRYAPAAPGPVTRGDERFLRVYLVALAALAWLAVLTGTYKVYPWYRATPPAGTTDLSAYPQQLLMAKPATAGWHLLGMEWKEHVAWLAPIAITMAAAVFFRYGRGLKKEPALRNAVLGFVWVSLLAAGVAGFFGAEIDDRAPVKGGATVRLMHGGE